MLTGISKRVLAILAAILTMVAAASAQTVDVQFPRGSSGTTIQGTITGDQAINYRLSVAAGQTMSVQLDTSNASNYFNITAPGASEALYNSSISGNAMSFVIPSSGAYVVTVYLMRNAARRNETANFDLTLYVENAAAASPRPQPRPVPVAPSSDVVSTELMPRFCTGEASAKFSVRPQDITVNLPFRSGGRYVVQGWFDGANGTTFFNCWFGPDGQFQSVS